jgi:hypothetical protein
VAQFAAVHAGGCDAEHCWFEQNGVDPAHAAQRAPLRPHALALVPVRHEPVAMSMHPPHGRHTPDSQVLVPGQAAHVAPPVPQCVVVGG